MHSFPEIQPIRESSRRMVRGLGILDPVPMFGVSFSQRHALIEIERAGALTVNGLGEALLLDRSVASRIVSSLEKKGWVCISSDPTDARKKMVSLTAKGLELTNAINEACDDPVASALRLLTPDDRTQVVTGLRLYGDALIKASLGKGLSIREIEADDDPQVAQLIRSVMTEIGVVGPGYSINDPEVLEMSRHYRRPRAAFFVLVRGKQILGCAGFGHLTGGADDICELRKMYFYPEVRGLGKAQELLTYIFAEAKKAGYTTMYLETTDHLDKARALYERNGFRQIDGPMGNTGHCACDTFYRRDL